MSSGCPPAGLQWVMNGYLLVIAAVVVTGGRLGDMFGRRTVFTIGLVVFAAGSVLSGAAWSEGAIIAGRVVQGIGAAAMLPLSLSIVCDVFPKERQARALGIWAAISALALAIGPLVGGMLVDLDWRLIFWINVPVLALGAAVMLAVVPETRDETATHRLDIAGLVVLALGLTAIVLPLIESASGASAPSRTLGILALGVALLLRFLAGGAPGRPAHRRVPAVSQRAVLRRQRGRFRPGRRLLEPDVLPAHVPAGLARLLGHRDGAPDPAGDGAHGRHLPARREG